MRQTLLTSALLLGLAAAPACLAQSAAPSAPQDQPAPAPDSGMATDTTQATGDTTATPPVRQHHHMARKTADADTGETYAHEPGTGLSGPASSQASNIDGSDSRSAIAPHLPQPTGGENAGPWHYLHAADRALAMKHTGEAQQALEMAETRLLDRSTPVDQAGQPDQGPVVQQVSLARQALGHGDVAGARAAVRTALGSEAR